MLSINSQAKAKAGQVVKTQNADAQTAQIASPVFANADSGNDNNFVDI